MTDQDSGNEATGRGVFIPSRWIPAPNTVSPQAHNLLANPFNMSAPVPSDLQDMAAWRAICVEFNQMLAQILVPQAAENPCEVTEHRVGYATLYDILPANASSENSQRAIYYLHGGAFIHGSGICAAYMAQPLATAAGLRVFSIDYRMPPDHPYPVGLEDALAGYREVIKRFDPSQLVVAGPSAGGGLAASLVLKIRDLGLPMPAA